jgi:hypothetical protein
MRKKAVTVVLIMGILLTFTGTAFSDWIPIRNKFGPITIESPAHPWGESDYSNNDSYAPPGYPSHSGAGYNNLFIGPVFTNFTLQFYFKYIIKKQKDGPGLIGLNGRSE